MKFRYGKYYARWTAEDGKRREKAFDTKHAAKLHQQKMARRRERKKAHPTPTSQRSVARG